ncbi:putative dihydrofolate synthetase [Cercospora beticola]|uniref:Putative dihydrofolate synthetase n=1 Tax=Cercospora beticola TaxID=122368 RepID=A0A2G5HJE6_CERBT|nr:putative dihydrofolate synthetase [Cercospora beticola]PIA92687.1 putative dihydrofolate synthetase [Cercospora beticola]WPB02217.1 hypothetical protein RHO25_006851 [Cercospora beticola]CAK1362921.1 unnamed protein product [Cercospora beticola]
MIELGLERISKLLSTTALSWRAVHVAGTNGKGTVCHLTSALLNAYNHSLYRESRSQPPIKHARFTSPHLVDRWDGIAFSDAKRPVMNVVSRDMFLERENAVKAFNNEHNINATEFELLTATAFQLFQQEAVDVAVVEVGLGGRLDSTNVIGEPVSGSTETKLIRRRFNPAKWRPKPLITTITQIGLDHQAMLGNTRQEIATQKAGIMKGRVPVTWAADQELDSLFHARAKALNAPVVTYKDLPVETVHLDTPAARRVNGELAIASSWTVLSGLGRLDEPEEARRSGTPLHSLICDWHEIVRSYVFPGRQETVSLEPIIGRPREALLDGAHNEDGVASLAQKVASQLRSQGRPIVWVVALSESSDRQPEKMLKPLLQQGDRVVAVEFGPVDGMPWVTPKQGEAIAKAAQSIISDINAKSFGTDVNAALNTACQFADQIEGHVAICGSLYLAGDVHRLLRGAQRT